jgi:hypothetical protein
MAARNRGRVEIAYLKLSIECNWSLLSLNDEAKPIRSSLTKPPNTGPQAESASEVDHTDLDIIDIKDAVR